jgi:hypothetical protein
MERYALHVLLGEEFVLHTDILYTREKMGKAIFQWYIL